MSKSAPKFLHSFLLDGAGRGRSLDASEVNAWTPADGVLWLHIDVADASSSRWLKKVSGLPASAVDTLLAGETRPRSIIEQGGLLLVLRGVNTNPGSNPEDMVSVRVWLDENRVITSQRRQLLSIEDLSDSLQAGKGPRGPGTFLVALVERLAFRIGGFVEAIEAAVDGSEEIISAGGEPGARQELGALRRQIAQVRRFLAPQRDALDRLNRQAIGWIAESEAHELRQEADRITRLLEDLDLERERAVVLQEELLSIIVQEQNTRMYVLSVVAAIFLPLTFVTGLLGMNVGGLPGLESAYGFVWSVVVMLVAGAGLILLFRFKKWL